MRSHLLMLGLSACALASGAEETRADQASVGQNLARTYCAACHAVGAGEESPNAEAPPLRTLSHRYDVAALEEALAEGISVGHPAMPEFQFSPDDVDALIAYLQSIQDEPENEAAPMP